MDDENIRKKLASKSQYTNRTNALVAWEQGASKADRKLFEGYVRNWLQMRHDGHSIGWKAFADLCAEDIPSFNVLHQALKGVLGERIKRL